MSLSNSGSTGVLLFSHGQALCKLLKGRGGVGTDQDVLGSVNRQSVLNVNRIFSGPLKNTAISSHKLS